MTGNVARAIADPIGLRSHRRFRGMSVKSGRSPLPLTFRGRIAAGLDLTAAI